MARRVNKRTLNLGGRATEQGETAEIFQQSRDPQNWSVSQIRMTLDFASSAPDPPAPAPRVRQSQLLDFRVRALSVQNASEGCSEEPRRPREADDLRATRLRRGTLTPSSGRWLRHRGQRVRTSLPRARTDAVARRQVLFHTFSTFGDIVELDIPLDPSKRDEENAKLKETLGKYREKWEGLKAGAKARREQATAAGAKDAGGGSAKDKDRDRERRKSGTAAGTGAETDGPKLAVAD